MRLLGLVLVIAGALALGYGGFTYYSHPTTDVGLFQVTWTRENTFWIPPIVSGIVVVAGLVLMVVGGGRKSV
jgi:hypothetical protein